MTRARLIERVIAEWIENETGATTNPETGEVVGFTDPVWSVMALAEAVDAEFDRIAREAGR